MTRCCYKLVAYTAVMVFLTATFCGAYQLYAPTEGQAVRENVKIQLPASAVPDSGFVSVMAGEPGSEKFVVALSRSSAKSAGGKLTFYWNSKAPYFDSKDPMKPQYFKDGRYPLTVQVHEATGKMIETATVNIEVKNRVPRRNPAPGINLANKLTFGQVNNYRIHSDVSFYEMVNRIGLPLLGGMGLSADSMIVQSVEDVRPGGEFLLRLREDDKTYVSAYGVKKYIYAGEELKPQLYRLVSKRGNVMKANMFAKQARFQIMDILPVLPANSVKEGDSWSDNMTLKIDGLTPLIKLKGNAMLDSFEWQNNRECVKITSSLSGNAPIWLANGKIQGAGPVNAEVTTYFAYNTGMMLARNILLSFDATIQPGAGDAPTDLGAADSTALPGGAVSPYNDEMGQDNPGSNNNPGQIGSAPGAAPGMGRNQTSTDTVNNNKKGRVEFNIVVRLEK